MPRAFDAMALAIAYSKFWDRVERISKPVGLALAALAFAYVMAGVVTGLWK